jgi:hypothetical protein
MSCEKFAKFDFKIARDTVLDAIEKSDHILYLESDLVQRLYHIDQKRFYVWFGYKSLQGFCIHALRLTRTQSQRVVTLVRRYEPTVNIGKKGNTNEQSRNELEFD